MRSRSLALLLAALPLASSAGATTFTVINAGATAYQINGANNPILLVERGSTYTFNITAIGHPFYIKTARVTGTGSAYTSGVTGNGTTNGALTWVVPLDAPNQLYYQCSLHSAMGGTISVTNPTPVPPDVPPTTAWIGPAIPNPSRRGAEIRYGLPHGGRASLVIVDLFGRKAREMQAGDMPAGIHTFRWDGRDDRGGMVPSGLYLYQLKLDDRVLTGRLMVRR